MAAGPGSDSPNDPSSSSWSARWCWTALRSPRPWNTYAYFRRAIDLPDRPTSAVVRLSADARYTLYVNGRRVHQGPARSFPHLQSYDTLDLADFLVAGPNAVCAIVHQFGVPTAQSVYRDASGFLLDGVVHTQAGAFPLHTATDWLCRDATAWRQQVARISPDLGFQEHFDADADPVDWLTPDHLASEETGWRTPTVVAPVNGHPWVSMRARNAPLLAHETIPFTRIVAQFAGDNARGYKVAEDVYHLHRQETRKKSKPLLETPDALLIDDPTIATVPMLPDGQFHTIVLDLGRIRTGHLTLDIADAAGDEIIDALYVADVDKAGSPIFTAGDNAPADRYRCRPGAQRWESFWPRGFRYAALVFRNVDKPLQLRHVGVRAVGAALEQAGAFECSDDKLNAVYTAGINTLRACLLDACVRGPCADQAQRWTDVVPTTRAATYAFGDLSLLERGILQVNQSQAADGSLHGHPPSDDPHARTLAPALAWVETLWEHYAQTARPPLLRISLLTLDRTLTFLERHEQPDGLIRAPDDPEPALSLNLAYLRALLRTASIYRALDLGSLGARATRRAETLTQSIGEHAWEDVAVHAQALAYVIDVRLGKQDDAAARDALLKSAAARRGKAATASPAQTAEIVDALIHADAREEAIEIVRGKWGGQIDRGATTLWEQWDGVSGSRCFAPAASPVYLLPQLALGVTPVGPGWLRVRIAPATKSLEFARGTVPTPHGVIRVEWEKVGEDQLAVRVELPPGTEGEFVGPLGETRQLDSGASEFHT